MPGARGQDDSAFRIHRDAGDGTNVEIQLTDGTSFSCCLNHKPEINTTLYKGGIGTPEILFSHESKPPSTESSALFTNVHNALHGIHWTRHRFRPNFAP